ncbi:MAG: amidohydrolase [Synergistaceae bacterium]|jgi:predicted amidohydrolase YtcJ|nr:amidohydrolase [Synergistaceae bacterium]
MSILDRRADEIFLNGRVYTVDRGFSVVEAIAVRDGRILWTGTGDQVKKYRGAESRVFDLEGSAVIPGLVESHAHILSYGEKALNIDCFMKEKDDILNRVRAAYEKLRPGEWIIGRGWNELRWKNKTLPSKDDLDRVAPDAPVCMTRVCGHVSWVNSKALDAAGIDSLVSDPVGGEFHRTASGELTGILADTAAFQVQGAIPPITKERREEAYLAAQSDILSLGLTSVHDLAANEAFDMDAAEFIGDLYRQGKMKISISAYVSAESAEPAYKRGPFRGEFGGRFSMRGVKVFCDGSLGARSAWLLEDYSDRPGHRGNGRYSDDELYRIMIEARRNGFQIAAHAIGDAANRQIIGVYERIIREIPEPKDHRCRIEHAQIVERGDMKRMLDLGVIPSMQFVHCTSDKEMTEDRIGAERLERAFAWRTLIDGGAVIPGGSDAPVELINPFHGMYAAVTRMDRGGKPEGGWRPEERISREEALRAFTIWGAYAAFEENTRGSIEPGKSADFAVIDRDIVECRDSDIKETSVRATVLGGDIAYGGLRERS